MGIEDIVKHRILVLDGAMGTVIQQYGLQGVNNDELCLSRPDVVAHIHRRYLLAGADIITTNTFNAQRISQADYGLQRAVRAINLSGARLARQCADEFCSAEKPRFVAGSVGPTNKTCSMSPDVSDPARRDLDYDTLHAAYLEQMAALIEGGVDLLLIETIFDTLNAKAAIAAALDAMEQQDRRLPIMLSVTVSDRAGRTLSGQTLDAFLASVSTFPIFSVGLNCSFGARQMKPYLEQLARSAPYYISAYPNAGLPNELGLYDETPETMAPQIKAFIDEGLVNIIGGCCGTTPDFIARYVPLVEGRKPHVPAQRQQALWLSGLEAMVAEGHTSVGERCNVAGSRKFLRLIKEKNYDEALLIARRQVADGALVLDINMDDGLLDAPAEMTHFLRLLAAEPDIAHVPVMVDSSQWAVIEAALKCVQGKSIVNSISLKEGEKVFLSRARQIQRLGAAVIVMCFDEQGQATTYERRIEIARRAYHLLTQRVGMAPTDIIFDPNILAVATGMPEHDAYALDFIRATAWIRQNLPGAHVSGGVSNLSFAFRGNNYLREAMHAVFLHHAVAAGMDFAIVNPAARVAYDHIPDWQRTLIEDVILCRRPDAAERLAEQAIAIVPTEAAAAGGFPAPASAPKDLDTRLQEALIRGDATHLETDLAEALHARKRAVDIIEGPLMAAMNEVGRRFGEGRMFLPQVVKTARTMKQAVAFLQPYIEQASAAGSEGVARKKILLATVKGDVHDIGKNIVAVVMACNGYDVIDMGVMVPAEQIVEKAIAEHVDMIGLSGLITPSLEEMVSVAKALRQAGLNIPIMIGGATTSRLHVALKIAPVYGGPVVWTKDASQNPIIAQRLMNNAPQLARELSAEYAELRSNYAQQQQQLRSIEEARRNRLNLFDNNKTPQ